MRRLYPVGALFQIARAVEACIDLLVSGAQPPRKHLHRQALELRRAPRQAGPPAGRERLGAIGDLRHAVLDGSLGGGEPAAAIAIAVAGAGRRPVLVVAAAHGLGDPLPVDVGGACPGGAHSARRTARSGRAVWALARRRTGLDLHPSSRGCAGRCTELRRLSK